ncbi:chondroitin AC/alginate lyase [Mycena vulgaris]|nr:chondroitin AC/alginate lyase [Mycena vulgaris]
MSRLVLFAVLSSLLTSQAAFVHPGIMLNATAIANVHAKASSTSATWSAAFAQLSGSRFAAAKVTPNPQPVLTINGTGDEFPVGANGIFAQDTGIVWQQALMWIATRNQTYANNAITFLNSWSHTLTVLNGTNAPLRAGLNGFMWAAAAELIRYTGAGWPTSDAVAFGTWLTHTFNSTIRLNPETHNWGQAEAKALMAIGVYNDDQATYDFGLKLITSGSAWPGCQSITEVLDPKTGQLAEMIARSQGDGAGCFKSAANLLGRGFDYVAAFNVANSSSAIVWNSTAFVQCTDIWWGMSVPSAVSAGVLSPIFELANTVYNQAGILHLNFGNVTLAKNALRPEPIASSVSALAADNVGLGTLLFAYY